MPDRAPFATLSRIARASGRWILDTIYPPICFHCEVARARADSTLCGQCGFTDVLPLEGERCPTCLGALDGLGVCADCFGAPMPFERVIAAGAFAGTLRRLVIGLKYHKRVASALPLGELLAARIAAELGTELESMTLVPVPLALGRRMSRGFNQAELIAREVARRLHLRLDCRVLARRGFLTPHLTTLSRARREEQMRSAFVARRRVPAGVTIILIDDVVTTTSTSVAASRVLIGAGAKRIIVAAPARTAGRASAVWSAGNA